MDVCVYSKSFAKFLILFLLIIVSVLNISAQNRAIWNDIREVEGNRGERHIIPEKFRLLKFNIDELKSALRSVPDEYEVARRNAVPTNIELPLPDGTIERFSIMESSIMEPELAEKYPQIKTYRGEGIDDKTASIRFDITPAGLHAMVISNKGSWFIDPYQMRDTENYISYWKSSLIYNESKYFYEEGPLDTDSETAREIAHLVRQGVSYSSGDELRTYRLAVATTGEYTSFHGGSVVSGLAAVVTAMNRVNMIYERDVAIRMILVKDNDSLIYTNSSTDPYTNTSGFTMLGENQANIDAVIGSANYDIGHVFSTGGGGIASLGVPCRTGFKARGVTGLPSPIGDPFYVDYVAHEMGHQWGGNHTFNGSAGSCAGGNRNASTAYEPGSGSTIMAYAGICGSQNIQNLSNDYFHGISLDEIIAYSTIGFGNGCPVVTSTGNTAPVVTVSASGFTIPINTPFMLKGSATDVDNDSLTFCWEEFDLGPAGAPNTPSGTAPIFRTFTPVAGSDRTFPKISDLLNNSQTIGELLPSYSRALNFRLTARDNNSGGGGIGKNNISFFVTNTAGPFLLTSPNTFVSWLGFSTQTVTWNVANTDISPVNTSNVNILLSTDGGLTWPEVIIANTPNDGTEDVIIPNIATTQARIKIEAVDNIFFDISNANFTIIDNPIPVELLSFSADISDQSIMLKWETATETNNSGFSIERRNEGSSFDEVGFVKGFGTTTEKKSYSFVDKILETGSFSYRLKQIDFDGSASYSDELEVDLSIPNNYQLAQNHPNPFNPVTTIQFSIPVDADVTIQIFNSLGEKVATILSENLGSGYHEAFFDASYFASGVYNYTLAARGVDGSTFASTKKMILMK